MEKMPTDLHKALTAKTLARWNTLTPIGQRDFVTWIVSAKQAETRKRRIEVTISKLLDGKRRPCCYAVVPLNLYSALNSSPKAKTTWKLLSSDEKRDFSDWVNDGKDATQKAMRVNKAILTLIAGKKRP